MTLNATAPVVRLEKRSFNGGVWASDLLKRMFPTRADLHDIAVKALAPKVGIPWRRLYRLLKGDTRMPLEVAGDIALVLKITPMQLQEGIDRLHGVNPTAKVQERYRREQAAVAQLQQEQEKARPSKRIKGLRDVWMDDPGAKPGAGPRAGMAPKVVVKGVQ